MTVPTSVEPLRVAVVGCGRISAVYARAFANLGDEVRVVHATDLVADRAEAFAAGFPGCAHGTDLDSLLEARPDVVHVLTPHHLHRDHVVAALRAGCHVLTEKPIAIRVPDAEVMIETARQSGRQLGVIFQNRWIPGVQDVRRLIAEGRMGRLVGAWSTLNWWRPPSYYACDWKGRWETEGGGVVIDQAIHSLDLVRHLMGSDVVSVRSHIDRRVLTSIEVEDVADAAVTFANGAVYSFFASNYSSRNSPIRVEIQGEKGRALLVGEDMTISLDGEPEYVVRPEVDGAAGESYWGTHHEAQVRDFYAALREGRPVPVDPVDATRTLSLVVDIYRSASSGAVTYPL